MPVCSIRTDWRALLNAPLRASREQGFYIEVRGFVLSGQDSLMDQWTSIAGSFQGTSQIPPTQRSSQGSEGTRLLHRGEGFVLSGQEGSKIFSP